MHCANTPTFSLCAARSGVRAAYWRRAWQLPSGKARSTSTLRRCWSTANYGGSWVGRKRTSRWQLPKPRCERFAWPSENAEQIGRDADAPPTLSLVDRFDTVLEVGRQITSALSLPMIFAEVRTAALRLLRGEHCLVLEAADEDGQERFTPVAGSGRAGLQRCLIASRPPSRQGRCLYRRDGR